MRLLKSITVANGKMWQLACRGHRHMSSARPAISQPNADRIRSAPPLRKFISDNLVDTFGREHDYLRISITERCNLRCLYCMPEEGVELSPADHLLTAGEIVEIAKMFAKQGVRKIRLTGGEPSVRKDLPTIIRDIGKLPGIDEICMTTNGIALARKLPDLVSSGLSGVNISLDTLVEAKYEFFTRRKGLQKVLNSIDTALQLGIRVKINVVVMRNQNQDEICDFIEYVKDKPIELRFIEYMPFDGNKWNENKMFTYREILETISSKYDFERLPAKGGDTAKVFQIHGQTATFGVISSMTSHFCNSCNRLRITADGNLKVCLFGNNEVSLRDMLRQNASEEDFLKVVNAAVKNKKEKHAGLDELANLKNRPMILIGG